MIQKLWRKRGVVGKSGAGGMETEALWKMPGWPAGDKSFARKGQKKNARVRAFLDGMVS
ncbi:MAG: hypothetical protein ACLUR9_07605 [Christensenellales bacterium]